MGSHGVGEARGGPSKQAKNASICVLDQYKWVGGA